eukprot:TRINITY_DN8859_c1_g3_i3.p1 TRINITY_DN8859_c1_g3~~TRINITY_DN8859_c1_g3_i3.p1  ORF type:complete len:230 (+),score=48.90 TRINITY_DN8859_c1_g3_i3:86-691(+)
MAGLGHEAAPAAAGLPPVYRVVGNDVVFACVTSFWQPSAREWQAFAAVCLPFACVAWRGLEQACEPLKCLLAWADDGKACLHEATGALKQCEEDLLYSLREDTAVSEGLNLNLWYASTLEVMLKHEIQLTSVSKACQDLHVGLLEVALTVRTVELRRAGIRSDSGEGSGEVSERTARKKASGTAMGSAARGTRARGSWMEP